MEAAHGTAAPILIDLPPALSEAQTCGRHCAWCGTLLTLGQSIDLGERDVNGRRAFPRGCRNCATGSVYRQLLDHSSTCGQCAKDATLCPDTAVLRRALHEARR